MNCPTCKKPNLTESDFSYRNWTINPTLVSKDCTECINKKAREKHARKMEEKRIYNQLFFGG